MHFPNLITASLYLCYEFNNCDLFPIRIDEEDELLYGISGSSVFSEQSNFLPSNTAQKKKQDGDQSNESSYWALLIRANKNLEVCSSKILILNLKLMVLQIFLQIYSLPDLTPVYLIKKFSVGHKLLVNSGATRSYAGMYSIE